MGTTFMIHLTTSLVMLDFSNFDSRKNGVRITHVIHVISLKLLLSSANQQSEKANKLFRIRIFRSISVNLNEAWNLTNEYYN